MENGGGTVTKSKYKQPQREPMPTGAITPEEIERIKRDIRIGDEIKWKVMGYGETQHKNPTIIKKMTVTRKSRHLFECVDKKGITYSVRYAEVAEAKRKDWARVKEMLRKAEQAGGRGK